MAITLDSIRSTVSTLPLTWLVLGSFVLAPFLFCFYRLFLHPLAKYPGPPLAKLTDLCMVWHTSQGKSHLFIQNAHEKYGPVVRIAPNKLAFNTVDSFHAIYNSRSVQKAKGYHAMNPIPVSNTVTFVDKDAHRQRRKGLNPAFSEAALRSFEPVIMDNVDAMLQEIGKLIPRNAKSNWSGPVNMIERAKYFTLDTMTAFGFGKSWNTQSDVTHRGVLMGMDTANRLSAICLQWPMLRPIETWIEPLITTSKIYNRAHYASLIGRLVKERMADSEASRDMISYVTNSKDEEGGAGLTTKEVWLEARTVVIAGTDTTAVGLVSCLFYLSRYPEAYNRLLSEVRGAFPTPELIHTGQELSDCTYVRAVINEAMRMSPPVGTALWRETIENYVVDGNLVPKGTDVGSAMYGLFRDPRYYPRANEFIPERWLQTDEKWSPYLKDARRAFHPFSMGARNCIGQTMSWSEITLALAKLVWFYDFRHPAGPLKSVGSVPNVSEAGKPTEEYRVLEYITPVPEGPYMEFRRREDIDVSP